MSMAVCDPEAFYPLRSLVAGPLEDLDELAEVERFVRAVVLHDEISMAFEPNSYDPEAERLIDEAHPPPRNVILAWGPDLKGYDFFEHTRKPDTTDIALLPAQIHAAREFSNADDGNIYYEAHIKYLQRLIGTVQQGGSALVTGEFGRVAIEASSKYPAKLFENLDREWQQFAQEADAGKVGFMMPPVLSIILTRCARRDAIPTIIRDLRDEWADARMKVWALLDQLKTVQTVAEGKKIRQELEAASLRLSPAQEGITTRPTRVLWDLIIRGVTGAATTSVMSGGDPGAAAIGAAIGAASSSVPPLIRELGPALFGRGAFDLARRIRRETLRVEYGALSRLLTNAEKKKLGL